MHNLIQNLKYGCTINRNWKSIKITNPVSVESLTWVMVHLENGSRRNLLFYIVIVGVMAIYWF